MSDLTIVGASVRAAAASALRAGFTPRCVDLFGDTDLIRACPTRTTSLAGYARAMMEILNEGPPIPWMYAGGMENHPDVFSISRQPLWGNSADAVRLARRPETLSRCGMTPMRTINPPRTFPVAPRWLIKSETSAGGLSVRSWSPGETLNISEYLQEFIPGTPASAVYVSQGGITTMLGASRQLIGSTWLHASRPFQYAGSIGPLDAEPSVLSSLDHIGRSLGGILVGLFGIDVIIDQEGSVRPIECNPRYTASIEVLERVTGRAFLADHAAAFHASPHLTPARAHHVHTKVHGKAILFAEHDIVFPADGPWMAAFDHHLADLDVPFADIPAPGEMIHRGDPVLTFFASGDTSSACENELRKIAADLDRVLFRR